MRKKIYYLYTYLSYCKLIVRFQIFNIKDNIKIYLSLLKYYKFKKYIHN